MPPAPDNNLLLALYFLAVLGLCFLVSFVIILWVYLIDKSKDIPRSEDTPWFG